MNRITAHFLASRGASWARSACAALATSVALLALAACGGSDDDVDRGPTTIETQAKLNGLYWDARASRLYLTDDDAGVNAIRTWDGDKGFPIAYQLPAMAADQRATLGQLTRGADGNLYTTRFGFGSSGTGSKFSPTTKQSTDKKAPKVDSDLSLGGIEIGYSLDKVHEILGKENSQETMKQGRVRYKYDHMNVIIYNGMVTALESNDGTVETKRGLHQDAALQAVFDAYGKDYELTDYNDLKLYEYTFTASNGEKGLLRFAVNKSDSKVNYITIRLPDPEPPKAQADVEGAKTVLARYEKAIGQHDFTTARNCLVPAMKGNLNSDGYKTTVSSEIVSMNVLSAESDKVELSYRLQAKDRSPSGSINTKYFTGTATMRYMDGGWLISGMESKEE